MTADSLPLYIHGMQSKPDGRPMPVTTRQPMNWRIPFDVVADIDRIRKTTKQDRTAVVVEALQEWCKRRGSL